MIKRQSFWRKALRSLTLRAFCYLENSGLADFAKNGENVFVDNIFRYFGKAGAERIVFFDIGANVGDYTQMLLSQADRQRLSVEVNLFEPTCACFDRLEKKFGSRSDVVLNRKAVSNSCGKARIFYDTSGSSLASLQERNLETYGILMNQSEEVETVRLDDYCTERAIGHIHFLKIDVEGHEMAALEGMGEYLTSDFVDFVQFEYGGANLDSSTSLRDLYGLFEKTGFVVAKVMRGGLEIRSYKPWMENYHYANYVAIAGRIADSLR